MNSTSGPNTHVLIVEDEIVAQTILSRLLSQAGYEVHSTTTLSGARKHLGEAVPSIMLLDNTLPDGTGLEFCAEVKANPRFEQTPIIFISASGDKSVKLQGFALGAVDFINKPFDSAEVLARVRTHLRLRAAYLSLYELQVQRLTSLSANQQLLMPRPSELPEAGFGVYLHQKEEAGGDFYDVLPSGNRVWDFIIADASGHDLGTSLWTAAFKTLLSEYASINNEPIQIMQMINRSLLRILPESAYFTAVYFRLNRSTRKLVVVNAGHPFPLLLRTSSPQAEWCTIPGDVLGMFPDAQFGSGEFQLDTGDRILGYSDGLIEVENNRESLSSRLVSVFTGLRGEPLEAAIRQVVVDLREGLGQQDDILVLGVQV